MLAYIVFAPFVFAILFMVAGKYLKSRIGFFVLPLPILLFAWLLTALPAVRSGEGVVFFFEWVPQLGINLSFSLDGLSMLFALLITAIGAVVVCYSAFYLSAKEKLVNFYVYLLLFMGSMLGVVLSGNLILTYLFWELTSVSSFLLIGYWFSNKRSVYGAQKALLLTVAGGFCLLLSFIMMGQAAGSYEIVDVFAAAGDISASPLYPAMVILLLLGAFTKSAQVPFHIWLPDAMEAPTPISCYLHSATMVKAGLFIVARMIPALSGSDLWSGIISSVGICSLVFGAYLALRQRDLKAVLACSTISQLGMIMTMLGYGSPAAIAAALFHLLNHSVFKGSLFLTVGMIDHATGTRDITKLRGLAAVMPVSAGIAALGALSMAGLPPFNGFLSKELFFSGSVEAVGSGLGFMGAFAWIFPALAVAGSIFTFVYSLSIFFKVFFGGKYDPALYAPHHPHEVKGMWIPACLLVSLVLIIAVVPGFFADNLLAPAVSAVTGGAYEMHISFWHGINAPLVMTAIVFLIGFILYKNIGGLKKLLSKIPLKPSSGRMYDRLIPEGGMVNTADRMTNFYMTGRLRDYTALITLFFILAVGGALFMALPAPLISLGDLAPVGVLEGFLSALIIAAVFAVIFAKTRLSAVLSMGVIGYAISIFFVLFSAPDLALTQLLVETITLILFFLAFRHLKDELRPASESRRTNIINALIAAVSGIAVFILTMITHSNKLFESIAWYYVRNSKTGGGGNNIVNVILVDFRGLDTMGEISVIGMAALGVFALISFGVKKVKGGEKHE